MPKSLKTISIGFPFKNPSVVCETSFATSRALFDFDLVVVRPYSLRGAAPSAHSGGLFRVEWPAYSTAKKEIGNKIADISRLLDQGGLLVVVLDVVEVLQCHTGRYTAGTIYTVTNYDFLVRHFFECVGNGSGDRVDCDPSDPFSKVIKNSSVFWTAFISQRMPYPYNSVTVFARNAASTFVGASVEMGSGHIVFLPNFKSLDENLFFEACQEYRFEREGTPPPAWTSAVYLPGQTNAEQTVSSLAGEIKDLEEKHQQAQAALDSLLTYKKLLFEKGKSQLEPVVVRALNDLGFQASPGEIIPGTRYEIDGRTKAGSLPGILEIKGSKSQIALDEFAAFPTKILADFQAKKSLSKGIFLGNGLNLEKPEQRLGDAIFSPHVLDAAKRNSVSLVNSVELYAVLCSLLDGQIIDLNALREAILTANGYADLRGYCAKLPFSSTK